MAVRLATRPGIRDRPRYSLQGQTRTTFLVLVALSFVSSIFLSHPIHYADPKDVAPWELTEGWIEQCVVTTRNRLEAGSGTDRVPISEILSLIKESGLTKVALRGDPRAEKPLPKSRIFSVCMVKAIYAAGYRLTSAKLWGEDLPDQDFYFMTHARNFVASTGYFGHLVAQIVNRRGGKIIGGGIPGTSRR